jgi:predicted nucleotidyltransferase component of viral defense system
LDTSRFAPDVIEKVGRLVRLLHDVRIHPFLSGRVALKGGTALNLFYLDMPRLSVDIDLNYLSTSAQDEAAIERSRVIAALTAISEGQGYRVTVATDSHALSALTLAYANGRGVQDTVKLEVNYMFRMSLGDPEFREARFPIEPRLTFRVVSLAELVGGKLVALLDRAAARDLYDAAALADSVDPQDPVMRRVFVALAGSLPRSLAEYGVERIERVTTRDIERHLYPVLASTDRPTRESMMAKVRPWLAEWLTLDPEEREFHDLLNSGVLQGALLLGSDPALAAAVDQHPGLLWKALNATKKGEARG